MNFGECYEILESGGFVARKSWDGIFLWMKQKANVKSEWCKDPILKMIAESNGGTVEAEQVLCKYDFSKRQIMTGWSPQQDDLAADDWVEAYVKLVDGKLEMKVYGKVKSDENIGFVGDLFDGAEVFKKP